MAALHKESKGAAAPHAADLQFSSRRSLAPEKGFYGETHGPKQAKKKNHSVVHRVPPRLWQIPYSPTHTMTAALFPQLSSLWFTGPCFSIPD